MTAIPERHLPEVADRCEKLVDLIRSNGQRILDGLADRPKPGDKQKAREAIAAILKANGDLWRFCEGKKPLNLTTGDDWSTEI